MSELIIKIIKEFCFEDRLGYFITDNAESNDVYINYIFKELIPELLSDHRSHGCIRC